MKWKTDKDGRNGEPVTTEIRPVHPVIPVDAGNTGPISMFASFAPASGPPAPVTWWAKWRSPLAVVGALAVVAILCGAGWYAVSGMCRPCSFSAGVDDPVLGSVPTSHDLGPTTPTAGGTTPSQAVPTTLRGSMAGLTTGVDHDGRFLIGTDIPAGDYRTEGAATDTSNCQWSQQREDDTIERTFGDMGIGRDRMYAVLRDGLFFETRGCKPWTRMS